MTRVMLGVAAVLAGLSGCASPAQVVSKDVGSGTVVISIPDNSDVWPTYNRRAAMELAEKQGVMNPERSIVKEEQVIVGQRTNNNQTVNGQMVQGMTTTSEVTKYQLTFQKKPLGPGMPMGAPGGVQQTQYLPGMYPGVQPAGGIVPSVQPGQAGRNVVPAGGLGAGVAGCADGSCALPVH